MKDYMKKLKKAAALSYDPNRDNAPKVVASGRGYIAEKIIEIAKENGIPMFEDELSSNILCSLPVNSEIPDSLYKTIAEIYAFILHMDASNSKNKK